MGFIKIASKKTGADKAPVFSLKRKMGIFPDNLFHEVAFGRDLCDLINGVLQSLLPDAFLNLNGLGIFLVIIPQGSGNAFGQ